MNANAQNESDDLVTIGDVSSQEDASRTVKESITRMGGLDVLVNCAGVADFLAPTVEQEESSWQKIIDINLTGTYLMCKAVGAHMLERHSGSIINISSIVGLGGFPRRNAYGSSKAGVIMLTRLLACEWGSDGVRVNCVAPGYVHTPLLDTVINSGKVDVDRIQRRTPMGRIGQPHEVAQAVAYLASSWSSYITGATLPFDGGWSAFGGAGDVSTA